MGTVNIWGKDGLFQQRFAQNERLAEKEAGRDDLLAQSRVQYDRDIGSIGLANAENDRYDLLEGQTDDDLGFGGTSALSKGRGVRDILGADGNLIGVRGSNVGNTGGGNGIGSQRVRRGGGEEEEAPASLFAAYDFKPLTLDNIQTGNRGLRRAGKSLGPAREGMSDKQRYGTNYRRGGQVQQEFVDPRSPEEIMAQDRAQQALQSAEAGGGMHRPNAAYPQQRGMRAPGYKWGTQPQPAQQPAPQPEPAMRGGYKWGKEEPNFNRGGKVPCFEQGGAVHPGMAKTGKLRMPEMPEMPEEPGPIGDPAMDTGEDVVDAKVRPGEVLINPPTVEYLGGGDYDQGLRVLNDATVAATGEPMGAEYDEEGTVLAAGGVAFDEYGRPISGTESVRPMNAGQAADQARANMPPPDQVIDRTVKPKAQVRGGTASVGPAPTAFREGLRMNNPNVSAQGVVDAVRRTGPIVKGAAKTALKPLEYVSRRVPQASAVLEGLDVLDVATDPNMNKLDVAEQTAESAAKWAGATAGAATGGAIGTMGGPLAPLTVPLGMAVGGGIGYFGTDKAIEYGRGSLPGHNGEGGSPSERSNGIVSQYMNGDEAPRGLPGGVSPEEYGSALYDGLRLQPEYQEQSFINPQGRAFTTAPPTADYDTAAGPLRAPIQSEEATIANYLANNGQDASGFDGGVNAGNLRDIPGAPGTQYAGRYGNQDVTVTEGAYGEPVFTGLRSPQEVAASTARSNAPVAQPTAEDAVRAEFDKLSALPRRTPRQLATMQGLGAQLADIEQTRAVGASRRAAADAATRTAVDKRIDERFTTAITNKNNEVTGHAKDPVKGTAFRDAMTKLGLDPYRMPQAEFDRLAEEFEPVYRDIMLGQQIGRNQGLAVSDAPRTGVDSIRMLPGSNIGLGDLEMFGGDMSFADYTAGIFDSSPFNDRIVRDPVSGGRMSLRRAAQAPGGGRDLEAMQRFGYLEGQ